MPVETPHLLGRIVRRLMPAVPRPTAKQDEQSPIFRLPHIQRTGVPARYLTVAAIAKNEAPYLDEWIAYHRIVGVEHFYIYENGSTDETATVLDRWREAGVVTWMPWPAFLAPTSAWSPTQPSAYAHAIAAFGADTRWLAIIDVDEYIVPLKGESVSTVLAAFEHTAGVTITRHNFGTSGFKTRQPGLTIDTYRMRAAEDFFAVKSIVDPTQVGEPRVHKCRDRDGKIIRHDVADVLVINHYFSRSTEEFEDKIVKGALRIEPTEADAIKRQRLARLDATAVQDLTIQRFVPAVKNALKR